MSLAESSDDVAVGEGYIDNVLAVGQRASIARALSRQRAADGVESVLSRADLGEFPDQNAAESLRRVAGANVLNDQGEGRFVAVRGLGRKRLLQYEEDSWTAKTGFRVSF